MKSWLDLKKRGRHKQNRAFNQTPPLSRTWKISVQVERPFVIQARAYPSLVAACIHIEPLRGQIKSLG